MTTKRILSGIFSLLLLISFSIPTLGFSNSLKLTDRQLCDLEMIMVGGFDPLEGFLCEDDYNSVVSDMRLQSGRVWPMPIMLDVSAEFAEMTSIGDVVELQNEDGETLATIEVSDMWAPDKEKEALGVFGTTDETHAGVNYLFNLTKDVYLGGKITAVQMPAHYDFQDLRKTPAEVKAYFAERGIDRVIGFQTRNPLHRAHVALTEICSKRANAHLFINPVVGKTKPGDINAYSRVRCYRKILNHFPEDSTTLGVLPLAMRMAGPREALWHALIRRNYGCTHFIVGRDHAGPGKDKDGNPFYGLYDAQDLVKKHEAEIGIELVAVPEIVYIQEVDDYLPVSEVTDGMTELRISGTEFRRLLREGEEIPSFISFPEIIAELRTINPSTSDQGLTVFLTGLSGAGKTTIAKALHEKLSEIQYRNITVLDGDIIRKNISPKLGFSKEDRSLNVRRVGFIASEITKNGGLAICSMIAPYEEDRAYNRDMISKLGNYVEVHVSTPLETCEDRDVKGLYALVRSGVIKNFTGVDDPYEEPLMPEIMIDTTDLSVTEVLDVVINHLSENGYLPKA